MAKTKTVSKPSASKQAAQVVKKSRLERWLPYLLIIGGLIGIICSLILTYDQIQVWKDPNYVPACSLNPILSCGSVIDSGQGHILGIPGPMYGLIAFPVLLTIGVAILAGASFKRWFWQGLQLGAIGGVGYALWLFWLSLYEINAMCPFCLVVDVVVYTVAWYITLYNLEKGNIKLPFGSWSDKIAKFIRQHHLDILMAWFLLLAIYILNHFWYYFGNHLPF